MNTAFPYPGGKSQYAKNIIQRFPDHRCYVEVFGGAGSVLLQKNPSKIEVYNDFNSDVVTFFEVAQENPDDLRERLRLMPYSRELFDQVSDRWFVENERPNDDVERAAEFLFLRLAGHGSLFRKTGFSASIDSDHAGNFVGKTEQISELADRFRGVVIENRDWSAVVEKYDGRETLFYLDPPYYDITDDGLYAGEPTAFDHETFTDTLEEIDGKFIVSYSDLPPSLDREKFRIESWDQRWTMATGRKDDEVYATERLVMNFDPDQVTPFAGADQSNLESFAGADD